MTFHDVLGLWFSPVARPNWFERSDAFDAEVRRHLAAPHERAAAGELADWSEHPKACLALVILLDQVPRNIFRGTLRAFSTDVAACKLSYLAFERGYDAGFDRDEKLFLYLPLQHSENLADQRLSVEVSRQRIGDPECIDYAERHLRIVERFGRFPHRNRALGRPSTPEEIEFLKEPGSSF